MINEDFLFPLLLSWIVVGWMFMTKQDCEKAYNHVPFFDAVLFTSLQSVAILAILISLILNLFNVGFFSTLCYIGILIVTQILNINILYKLYRVIFGYSGIGALLPAILILPLLIWLYIS